jgi:hypothetical protein
LNKDLTRVPGTVEASASDYNRSSGRFRRQGVKHLSIFNAGKDAWEFVPGEG